MLAATEAMGRRLRIDFEGRLVGEGRGRLDPDLEKAIIEAEAGVIGAPLARGLRETGAADKTGQAAGREQAPQGARRAAWAAD